MNVAIIVLSGIALLLTILSISLTRLDKRMYMDTLDKVAEQRNHYRDIAESRNINHVLAELRTERNPKMRPSGRLRYPVRRYGYTIGYVYLMCINSEYHKIGYAARITDRLSDIQVGSPYKIEVLHVIACHHAVRLENILHNHYADRWVNGEWFKLTDDDVATICAIASPVTIDDLDRLEQT